MKGYANRVVKIDLTTRTVSDYPISDRERELFLGGKVLSTKILWDLLPQKIDAFDEQNPIVIMTSPLTGSTAACSSRFNVSCVSPLTGLTTSSNCGGSFGIHLKRAGLDGVIIVGRADKPVWLDINDGEIAFNDAGGLWGKFTGETQELIGGKNCGRFVIGPAGENLVRYAAVVSDERAAGRNGVGAVFGSKNLKALRAAGTHKIEFHNPERFKKLNVKWINSLRAHPLTGKQLPTYGTAGLVSSMNYRNLLATKNYQEGSFDGFERISGEELTEKYLIKNKGCTTCPIQCGRVVTVNGNAVKGPEVETLALLGSNLLNDNMQKILDANHYCDEYGIDTISFGSSVGFAMELCEKGLWDCGLRFGDPKLDLVDIIKKVSLRKGIGEELSQGTRRMSKKFGGEEFAINVKGLELAAYEPRAAQGMGLGYATANRGGCHLNGGYMVVMEGLGLNLDGTTPKGKAAFAVFFQDLMEAISAGGSCLFTSYAILPAVMVEKQNKPLARFITKILPSFGGIVGFAHKNIGIAALNAASLVPYPVLINHLTGMKLKLGSFVRVGERGYNLERLLNIRFGVTSADDTLPKRLLTEKQRGSGASVSLDKMKKTYYKIRRWEDGVPNSRARKILGV